MSLNKKPKAINPDEIDPSVYYYDEVYDEIHDGSKQQDSHYKESKKSKVESKYIKGLKETADLRKTESDIRKFKRYADDRAKAEAGGDLNEEDVYVSQSYKKKLEEIKKLEQEKRRRIQNEEDNVMNFLKHDRSKRNADHGSKNTIKVENSDKNFTGEINKEEYDEPTSSNKTDLQLPKRPKTLEERREYLRQVLSKRTVGDAYREAIKRYKERRPK